MAQSIVFSIRVFTRVGRRASRRKFEFHILGSLPGYVLKLKSHQLRWREKFVLKTVHAGANRRRDNGADDRAGPRR